MQLARSRMVPRLAESLSKRLSSLPKVNGCATIRQVSTILRLRDSFVVVGCNEYSGPLLGPRLSHNSHRRLSRYREILEQNTLKPAQETSRKSNVTKLIESNAIRKAETSVSLSHVKISLSIHETDLARAIITNHRSSLSQHLAREMNLDTRALLPRHLAGTMAVALPGRETATLMFRKLYSRVSMALMSTMPPKNETNSGSGSPIESRLNPKGLKTVKVNACGELYAQLSITNPSLYGSAPKHKGINFEVVYYDSYELLSPQSRAKAPVVCLLHGAPGSYKDFHSLISYLSGKGIRVLAPNFPDYTATYEHSFRHSPRERYEFLNNFLDAIKVESVDMMIGHSSAIYTIFEMLEQDSKRDKVKRIKSLGLFSTPTYNLPPNLAVTPLRLFTLKLFDYPILRPLIQAVISTFVKLQGIRNKVDPNKIEKLLIAASAVGYSDNEKMVHRLDLVKKLEIPTLLVMGFKDNLIPVTCYEQLKRDLGLSSGSQMRHYSSEGKLLSDSVDLNSLVRVSQFESGGHYTFQKFDSQVNEDVYQLLRDKVMNDTEPEIESSKL